MFSKEEQLFKLWSNHLAANNSKLGTLVLILGSLLVFIFTWAPALTASAGGSQSLNMGLAFASFMLAITAGI